MPRWWNGRSSNEVSDTPAVYGNRDYPRIQILKIINSCNTYTCPGGGMVDTEVSKSSASRLAGSSPALGTRYRIQSIFSRWKIWLSGWLLLFRNHCSTRYLMFAKEPIFIGRFFLSQDYYYINKFFLALSGEEYEYFLDYWNQQIWYFFTHHMLSLVLDKSLLW